MNLIIRKASACWKGGPRGGVRTVTTARRVLKCTKFPSEWPPKETSHTDPAELIAAAHASSFSSALSRELGLRAGARGETLTASMLTLEQLAAGWLITRIHLNVVAKLPKVTQERFIDAIVRAKANCLVSRLLKVSISMNAKLET